MEESQIADYFVVAGLPDDPEPMDDYTDRSHLKQNHCLEPITDITVIFPEHNEYCPVGWEVLDRTPTGLMADLNYGSVNSPEVYICYKRGRDKPPLVDIGVLYENKDRILSDSEIVLKTPTGKMAYVNSSTKTYLTYRRAPEDMPANELVVTDICVIIASKGEKAPHAFCVIKKNLNKGLFGGEIYLCYKKSMNRANVISYKPGILYRYPLLDRTDWKLHANVPLFCLPMGASLEVWPPQASQPPTVFSTFILTVSDASEKVYGSAVTFYEEYPVEKLTKEQLQIFKKSLGNKSVSDPSITIDSSCDCSVNNSDDESLSSDSVAIPRSYRVNVNKCICLLSHWPFFDTFDTFLKFLYKLSISGPHSVPIERYISHFLENVPFPSPQRPRILVQLSSEDSVVLFQPEDLPLPRSGAGFRELLRNLGPEDSLLVLLLVLTEHKILVHSLRPSILTAVVEAISMIIFPFKWQCPYIPLCPLGLAEVLHAPLPFLIGVDSRFFDMYDPPADVTCVDLDTNHITVSEEKGNFSYKLLPKRAARNLKNSLEDLYKKYGETDYCMDNFRYDDDVDGTLRFYNKEKEQRLQLEIQEAFLRFMATILKGYRSYLLPITKAPTVGTTDPNSLFDLQGFLKSRDRAYHKFFVMLMKTQMFIRFIEERSFVSDMDAGLAFFDECTEKVDNEDHTYRLLEFEESHKSERTVVIPPPEPAGLAHGATYLYQTFSLDNNLFRHKESKNNLNLMSHENTPGSPMARRTKHEVKCAQKLARRKHSQSAQSWAKCLLTTCYSLWFIHLPSFVIYDRTKSSTCLKLAYDLLVKIQKLKLHPTDEVCYRVMMQLFGIHSQPVLAVNLLSQMKLCGIQPNALTYGYYNRAVLEATWPSDLTNPTHLWNKLRNVIIGAALFRRGGHKKQIGIAIRNKLAEAESCTSLTSIEKGDLISDFEKFDRMRSALGYIVKPYPKYLQELLSNQIIECCAGIIMTGLKKSPTSTRRKKYMSPKFPLKLSQTSSDSNAPRLKRGSISPTLSENKMLKILMRSDSFANDISIVEKHNRNNKDKKGFLPSDEEFVRIRTRESSESLNTTDDVSLSESWNSDGNYTQNVRNSPAKPPISKSNITDLSSLSLKTSQKTLQESLDSAHVTSSEKTVPTSVLLYPADDLNSKLPRSYLEDPLASGDSHLNTSDENIVEIQPVEFIEEGNSDKVPNGVCLFNEVSSTSPVKMSPVRVPVTENDPLGALRSNFRLNSDDRTSESDVNTVNNSTERNCDNESPRMKYDLASYGLFCNHQSKNFKKSDGVERMNKLNSRKKEGIPGESPTISSVRVPKSATFHHSKDKDSKTSDSSRGCDCVEEEVISSRKAIQRSTTLPDATSAAVPSSPSVASSLSHLSSSLKFSLSRYSPSRFSLKKSDLRATKTQLLENAISGSKKSNELLISGYNTFKSAATSIAKRIEEAISTNTTPVKSFNTSYDFEEDEVDLNAEKSSALDFESWGTNLKEFFGDGSRKGSSANLQNSGLDDQPAPDNIIFENLYGKNAAPRNFDEPAAIAVVMTTCCKCNNCNSVLHDEEIIAGWTPDDSNLNTNCHFCGKSTLPFLSITIYDYRKRDVGSKQPAETANLSHSFLNRQLNCSSLSVHNSTNLSELKEQRRIDSHMYCLDNETEMSGISPGVTDGDITCSNNYSKVTYSNDHDSTNVRERNILRKNDNDDHMSTVSGNLSRDELQAELIKDPHVLEPINVPYLNPLVLRKELENILHHEGDPSLTKPSFVDHHPIVYWNMVWVFERINVSSHLPGLAVKSCVINKDKFIHPSWKLYNNQGNVLIRCLWDNPRLYEEMGQPGYLIWQHQDKLSNLANALITERFTCSKSVMESIIASLLCGNLLSPMRKLINERIKLRKKGFPHSLYRDLLFLAITAFERSNIDFDFFDREYNKAYEKLKAEGVSFLKCDKPPVSASYRNYFRPLFL